MQSRESIPNVGRRAQGRKALFILKGSGVMAGLDQEGDQRNLQPPHDSLSICDEDGFGETPATYDESILSQPSHPYNRIIQQILNRHRVADKKQDYRNSTGLTPRTTPREETGEDTSRTQTYNAISHHKISPDLQVDKTRLSRKDKYQMSPREPKTDKEHRKEKETRLEWSEIVKCPGAEDQQEVQSGRVSALEDQSTSSLDLARGYLTDRGYYRHQSFQDSTGQSGVMDRDCLHRSHSQSYECSRTFPRAGRKRDLQPLDDLLDYFWVYQGMTRQVLHPNALADPWSKPVHKKPIKLPPIYISTGQKAVASVTSSDRIGSSSAEDTDTPNGSPRAKHTVTVPHYITKSPRQSQGTSSTDLESQIGEADFEAISVLDDAGKEHDAQICDFQTQFEERGGGRAKVTLVVKMPVLTQESTCSDLLDID